MNPSAAPRLWAALRLLSIGCAFALAACSSQPPLPDWQMNAQGASQKAIEAYLSGNTRVEKLEWDRARAEVARTGRPDLLARLELMRCAAQVASLVTEPCERFEALRADSAAPEQAYADYLAGRVQAGQVALLPAAQRAARLLQHPHAQRLPRQATPPAGRALPTLFRAWWRRACCCRRGTPAPQSSPQPPIPRRHRAGAGR